jgi:hypothetical protein
METRDVNLLNMPTIAKIAQTLKNKTQQNQNLPAQTTNKRKKLYHSTNGGPLEYTNQTNDDLDEYNQSETVHYQDEANEYDDEDEDEEEDDYENQTNYANNRNENSYENDLQNLNGSGSLESKTNYFYMNKNVAGSDNDVIQVNCNSVVGDLFKHKLGSGNKGKNVFFDFILKLFFEGPIFF